MYYKKFRTPLYDRLTDAEKTVVDRLVTATKLTDEIFVQQLSVDNTGYPKSVTKEQLVAANMENPEILSPHTIVVKQKSGFAAIPYEIYYRPQLVKLATLLVEAAAASTDSQFKQFLYQRAVHLLEGGIPQSEATWLTMTTDYPVNVAIGPLLTYHDELFSKKAFYTSCVYIRNIEKETFYKQIIKKISGDIRKSIPYPSDNPAKKGGIEVGDVVSYGGEVARMKAVAWSRPATQAGCEAIIEKFGTKNLLFENAITLRFKENGVAIYKKLFSPKVQLSELIHNTLLGVFIHELGHGEAVYTDAQTRLSDVFWEFEELKCDLFALHCSVKLAEYGFISEAAYTKVVKGVICDLLSQYKLSQTIKERKSHAFSGQYVLVNLLKDTVLVANGSRYIIDYPMLQRHSHKYVAEITGILAKATNSEGKLFIEAITKQLKKTGAQNLLATI